MANNPLYGFDDHTGIYNPGDTFLPPGLIKPDIGIPGTPIITLPDYNPDVPLPPEGHIPLDPPDPHFGELPWHVQPDPTFGQLTRNLRDQINRSIALGQQMLDYNKFRLDQLNRQILHNSRLIFDKVTPSAVYQYLRGATLTPNSPQMLDYMTAYLIYIISRESLPTHPATQNPEFKEAYYRVLGTGYVALQARAMGTLFSTAAIPLHPLKFFDPWMSSYTRIGSKLVPGLAYIAVMQQLLDLVGFVYFANNTVIAETDKFGEIDVDDEFNEKVVPVPINTPAGQITVTQSARSQTISVDISKKTPSKRMPLRTNMGGAIRPYPSAVGIIAPPIIGQLVDPVRPVELDRKLRPIALTTQITKQLEFVITRAETGSESDFWRENNRSKDKKSISQTQYMAMQRLGHRTFGKVSEIIDFKDAVFDNTLIKYGGMWYTLGKLAPDIQRQALQDAAKSDRDYIVDWQATARQLLHQEFTDHQVGALRTIESQAWTNAGLGNTLGTGATWINRL